MTITYPVTISGLVVREMEWESANVAGENVSPYDSSQEAFEWPGKRRRVSVICPPMKRAVKASIRAGLESLHGAGTFLLGPVGEEATLRGTAAGTILVNGAHSARAKTLALDGLTAGQTFLEDDWLQLGSGATAVLYRNLTAQTANGSGEVTLDVWPALRSAVADNAAVTVANPKGVFRMTGHVRERHLPGGLYELSFEAQEAF